MLGQIDPGPVEAALVDRLYARDRMLHEPIPPEYWISWRREVALADLVMANSDGHGNASSREAFRRRRSSSCRSPTRARRRPRRGTCPTFHAGPPPPDFVPGPDHAPQGRGPRSSPRSSGWPGRRSERPLSARCRSRCRGDQVDPSVRFTGPVPRDAVAAAYAERMSCCFPPFGRLRADAARSAGRRPSGDRLAHCGAVVEDGVTGLILDAVTPERSPRYRRLLAEPRALRGWRRRRRLQPPASASTSSPTGSRHCDAAAKH